MKRHLLFACLLASAGNAAAQAQPYPVKPIRIVVPFAAGSGADANPRFYGEWVSKLWGQSIVVDNRPGGSGIIAVQKPSRALRRTATRCLLALPRRYP